MARKGVITGRPQGFADRVYLPLDNTLAILGDQSPSIPLGLCCCL
ncbi:MAG: hypothetical protein VKL01_01195 [Limnothrix sp.]|nr:MULTISPECIES: hypothetical protein [unclassified Limnothrix]MEB3116952.1 hypothetical protein [Limnothrix sp.]